ncbi:histone deacetylase [Nocardioides mangrovicus]|uniref:Histone deacetylase n=1 Tax=Nocardioides mangrovicus TaxID=2478913 RepID=A0A3L8P812_9ACTN|nr:histone deacetylase [Nocardioides mangrovicus]RLV51112.1 histone deacetylase [Nocardioides mangrovicus]
MSTPDTDLVWYAGYGSNLDPARFGFYLGGGRPPGARRAVPGARDSTPPRRTRPVELHGEMVFGWESPTWGGGISFFDATGTSTSASTSTVLATAYLLTSEQFSDVAAQEMHREPGTLLQLDQVLATRSHAYGPGRYETVHLVGEIDGSPVLTFTCDDPEHLPRNAPAGAYLATLTRGLRAVHGLADDDVASYLLGWEGMETWAPDEVARLVAATT